MAMLLVWCMYSDTLIFGGSNANQCSEAVAPATITLLAIVVVKLILTIVATYWMCCSNNVLNNHTDE